MIYITSDLHFFHDREFIYKPRGFSSVEEMNQAYVSEWQTKVSNNDDIYVLGDFCLGNDYEKISNLLNILPGRIHLIIGNHDTPAKLEFYAKQENVVDIKYADVIQYKRRRYYLSHYVTMTSTLESNPSNCVINLHGHLHTSQKFYEDRPYLYNVSVDANENHLLTMDEIERNVRNEINKCISLL